MLPPLFSGYLYAKIEKLTNTFPEEINAIYNIVLSWFYASLSWSLQCITSRGRQHCAWEQEEYRNSRMKLSMSSTQ